MIYLGLKVKTKSNFVSTLVEVLAFYQWGKSEVNAITDLLLVGETNLAGIIHFSLQSKKKNNARVAWGVPKWFEVGWWQKWYLNIFQQ